MSIMIVGESYGDDGRPFEGASFWLLKKALAQVGIDIDHCYLTPVFKSRVEVTAVAGPKPLGIPGMASIYKGKYMPASYAEHLQSLYKEINNVNPNLILAVGPTAAWALCNTSGVRNIRGASRQTEAFPGLARRYQVLPTYHPDSVLREYSLYPVFLSDLDKARRYSAHPEFSRPSRKIWLKPTLEDLAIFGHDYLEPAPLISIDIETVGDQMNCIGFAPSPSIAIVVPLMSHESPNYWPTAADERAALGWVKHWCETKPCLFQNGMYDMNRLWRSYGIRCYKMEHDTMLLHHALQPEMQKGLGFLGTIYTDEASWKFMRGEVQTTKKED